MMPLTTRQVHNGLEALCLAIDGLIDTLAHIRNPILSGCAVMPYADLVISGTNCRRPLILPEADKIAGTTGCDFLLLRNDLFRGTSFDIRLQQREGWLFNYLAWRREGDLWLIPQSGECTYIRAVGSGLELEQKPPFSDAEDREAGIIRVLTKQSLEGRA